MLQLLLIAASIGLIILGIKGFTKSGLTVSRKTTLTGTPAKVIGTLCILAGLGLVPTLVLALKFFFPA